MFAALAISAFLVTVYILVHYEALRLMSVYIPNCQSRFVSRC